MEVRESGKWDLDGSWLVFDFIKLLEMSSFVYDITTFDYSV